MTTPAIERLARDAAVEVAGPSSDGEQPTLTRRQAYITAVASDWLSCSIKFPESTDPIPARFMHPSLASGVGETVWVDQNGPDTVVSSARGLPMGVIEDLDGRMPVPPGWLICDGRSTAGYPISSVFSTTPDLRDKFLVSSGGAYSVGQTGGEATHVISEAEMPSHNHAGFHHTHTGPSHTHPGFDHSHGTNVKPTSAEASGLGLTVATDFQNRVRVNGTGDTTGTDGAAYVTGAGGTGATSADGNAYVTGTKGSGTAHENRPPFYAVVRIIKAF